MEFTTDSYEVQHSLHRAIARVEEFRSTRQVHLLLYAAVDTRLCIERTLFEYLVLISSENLPAKLERLYSATDLKKAILSEEPEFVRKIEFMDLFVKFLPYENPVVVVPDLDLLSECYGRSNNYLHSPKRPDDTWSSLQWWTKLEQSLNSAIPHLIDIHSGLMSGMNLNERGEELFRKFVAGEVPREEVVAELERSFAKSPPIKV